MRSEFGDALTYATPESPKDLSEVLISLIDDTRFREQLGIRAREFIEKGKSWKVVTEKIVSLCEPLVIKNSRNNT